MQILSINQHALARSTRHYFTVIMWVWKFLLLPALRSFYHSGVGHKVGHARLFRIDYKDPGRAAALHLGMLSKARSEMYLLGLAAVAPLSVAKGYKLLIVFKVGLWVPITANADWRTGQKKKWQRPMFFSWDFVIFLHSCCLRDDGNLVLATDDG